ncbi:alanine--tRNA ligase [Candidatus Saccharibacteria bacterium RIFCSPHIGHO2_12_FULL_47_16b]|nr:MAG: alanine--tRNA ligase [Candidatus Saccharibacteria bacterium RIFCSPHIGHO2_12_FULL_47_16b]
MMAQEIRQKYLEYFKDKGHKVIPRASLIPQDDPTTLFTGSGMQPLVPYLLGKSHPAGKRLVDSQTCFRAEDMDEVGDNRHTTFFEMLGNFSLGDYYKEEQLTWFWEFLIGELKLPKERLWVTCFEGDKKLGIPKDTESAEIWKKLGVPEERIAFYGADKNWWSREGEPSHMREGEPGGPDSEVFYEFTSVEHDKKFGDKCHPNCDCGRFLEIGNSVFMTYRKVDGKFEHLPKPNVDFGGGLERLEAANSDNPDIFQISLIKPIIEGLEKLSGKDYEQHQTSMRVIADHLRAATFLAVDGAIPSNKAQGYVLRRLLRRSIRYAFELGIEQQLCEQVVPIITELYAPDFPEVAKQKSDIVAIFAKEEKIFRQTLRSGVREFTKLAEQAKQVTGGDVFKLYDTYGFPVELSLEEAYLQKVDVDGDWQKQFDKLMAEQRQRSQTASVGMFKGGLADHSEAVVKLHTTTHLMYRALKNVLGDHVVQRGSNITAERTRFDFSHPEKVTAEQIKQVEDIVNQKIAEDLPVSWKEESTKQALKTASGAFGDKYGDKVKVYTVGDPKKPFSREICGGPHVEHTGVIAAGGKKFKIVKEEASSAGVRRIKAVLQ